MSKSKYACPRPSAKVKHLRMKFTHVGKSVHMRRFAYLSKCVYVNKYSRERIGPCVWGICHSRFSFIIFFTIMVVTYLDLTKMKNRYIKTASTQTSDFIFFFLFYVCKLYEFQRAKEA